MYYLKTHGLGTHGIIIRPDSSVDNGPSGGVDSSVDNSSIDSSVGNDPSGGLSGQ